jgi:enediyne biosynthesis protein E4
MARFTDVSVSSGFRAHPGKGMGVAAADYLLDGRMDFFIANNRQRQVVQLVIS